MPRIRLNDNCHGKVLFISDSVKKQRKIKPRPSCKLLKKLAENQVIKFIWPYVSKLIVVTNTNSFSGSAGCKRDGLVPA